MAVLTDKQIESIINSIMNRKEDLLFSHPAKRMKIAHAIVRAIESLTIIAVLRNESARLDAMSANEKEDLANRMMEDKNNVTWKASSEY